MNPQSAAPAPATPDRQAKQGQPGARAKRGRSGRPCPPALTGGESPLNTLQNVQPAVETDLAASVDWLTVTWLPDPAECSTLIPIQALDLLRKWLGAVVFGVSVPGIFGYDKAVRFYVQLDDATHHHIGRVDYGGQHHKGRARLDLSGSACSRITAWHDVCAWLDTLFDCKLTRVDLAVDLLDGQYTVDHAAEWYRSGDFNAGGRMPRHSTVGDWLSDQSTHGRTLEVGRRSNGKMLRCYEKGRQLGDPDSKWTRFEVEIRNIDRDIPIDILTRRDEYFVGAYKCLERILDAASVKVATHQREGEITLEKLTQYARTAYGQTVHVLRASLSADEVLAAIARPGVPKRLEKASLAGFHVCAPPGQWSSPHENDRLRF